MHKTYRIMCTGAGDVKFFICKEQIGPLPERCVSGEGEQQIRGNLKQAFLLPGLWSSWI